MQFLEECIKRRLLYKSCFFFSHLSMGTAKMLNYRSANKFLSPIIDSDPPALRTRQNKELQVWPCLASGRFGLNTFDACKNLELGILATTLHVRSRCTPFCWQPPKGAAQIQAGPDGPSKMQPPKAEAADGPTRPGDSRKPFQARLRQG